MSTLTKLASTALIACAFGLGAVGPGGAVATALPVLQAPEKPRHDDYCPPWCGDERRGNRGNDNYCPPWCDNGNRGGHSDKGPWWASNAHPWWDDRNGPPPWGWGPPPAYQWQGGPPRPFNYWGYDVNPVWDDGFRQWGFYLFGLWIPVFGIG